MKIKRVALCVHTLDLGGAQVQALLYARTIKGISGVQPVYISLQGGNALEEWLIEDQVEYHIFHFNLNKIHQGNIQKLKELIKVARQFRKLKLDVIIPFTFYPNVICNLATFLIGIRHRFWNQRGWELFTPVSNTEKLAIKLTRSFLGNSEEMRKYLEERYHINTTSYSIIPNILFIRNPVHEADIWRKRLKIGIEEIVVVMVANYFRAKDHITAIEAFSILCSNHKDIRLLLVGYSPDPYRLNEIKSLAFDRGLGGKVLFIESTNDIPGLLSATNIGLFITNQQHTEGSPNVILEYMMAGLPIVASDIPPVRELLRELPGNHLSEPENKHSVVRSLEDFIKSSHSRSSIGEVNKSFVMTHHHPATMKKNLQSLFEKHHII